MCNEWQGLAKTVRTALKKLWPEGGRQPVPVVAALWFGTQIREDDRSEEWPEVMMALWICTRVAGPFKWQRRSAEFMDNPVVPFRADCLDCITVATASLSMAEMSQWKTTCVLARTMLRTLAIEPIYAFLRMANLPSAESGHLGAFVEAFLELAVTRGKNIDIWAQILREGPAVFVRQSSTSLAC